MRADWANSLAEHAVTVALSMEEFSVGSVSHLNDTVSAIVQTVTLGRPPHLSQRMLWDDYVTQSKLLVHWATLLLALSPFYHHPCTLCLKARHLLRVPIWARHWNIALL